MQKSQFNKEIGAYVMSHKELGGDIYEYSLSGQEKGKIELFLLTVKMLDFNLICHLDHHLITKSVFIVKRFNLGKSIILTTTLQLISTSSFETGSYLFLVACKHATKGSFVFHRGKMKEMN